LQKRKKKKNEKKVKVIASGIFAPNEQELGEGTVQVCRDKIQRKNRFTLWDKGLTYILNAGLKDKSEEKYSKKMLRESK
jgi:hypothetical protein